MANNDERRYRRISLDLPARIVVNTTDEYNGRLLNISPGSMALIGELKAITGDAVVVRIKGLDVIEGTVARIFPDGIGVSYLLSKRRRALLTENLVRLANPEFAKGLGDRRGAPRHPGSNSRTTCRLPDGTSLFVKVVDMSVDGVSVDAPRRPAVGTSIMIGRQRGMIVRHTPRGFVVVYDAEPVGARPILRAV